MEYTHLGRSGLYVSRLCLGTMNFGSRYNDEAASLPILDRALELGYNFIDTANGYGDPWRGGRTEKVLGELDGPGRWSQRPGRAGDEALQPDERDR